MSPRRVRGQRWERWLLLQVPSVVSECPFLRGPAPASCLFCCPGLALAHCFPVAFAQFLPFQSGVGQRRGGPCWPFILTSVRKRRPWGRPGVSGQMRVDLAVLPACTLQPPPPESSVPASLLPPSLRGVRWTSGCSLPWPLQPGAEEPLTHAVGGSQVWTVGGRAGAGFPRMDPGFKRESEC